MGGLEFSYSDMYPGWGKIETSTLAQPSADDQEALQEDTTTSEKADVTKASKYKVFLAFVAIILMVLFLGVGGA